MIGKSRVGYPSDVSEAEWEFVIPYLLLCKEDAKQRKHELRAIFNAVRYVAKTGCHWRMLPNDFPPYWAVHAQLMRWIRAQVFEKMAKDLRELCRMIEHGRDAQPSVAIIDSRTVQSTPESGARAGYDAGKKKRGSKVHAVVDTLGHLLALVVTPANEQDRAQVKQLAADIQEVTNGSVELCFADQGYTGAETAEAAQKEGIKLMVVKKMEGQNEFIVLPKRWIVERTQGCLGRFRRLARDYERRAETLASLHWVAAVYLMLHCFFQTSISP